jgi:hypothetical protein
MIGATPAELACGAGDAPSAHVADHGEAQAEADTGRGVPIAEVVRRHQRHRPRRQDAHASELAAVQQHLEEPGVVRGRGDEPGAAREAAARPVHVRALALHGAGVGGPSDQAILAGGVHGGEAVRLVSGQEEVRVVHPEGLEDARPQEVIQALPRYALDDHTEDVGGVAVDEAVAGLGVERQTGDPRHGLADGLVTVCEIPAGDVGLPPEILRRPAAVADARGVRE